MGAAMPASAQQTDVPICCTHQRYAGDFIDVYLNFSMCDDGGGGRRCDPGCLAAGNDVGDCCWFQDRKQVARSLVQALNEWNTRG